MRVRRVRGTEEALRKFALFDPEPSMRRGRWRREGYDCLYAEFGGGKGGFILQQALIHPENDYLMIDVVPEILIKAVRKANRMTDPPANLRFAMIDLKRTAEYFGDDELDRIYLNFSDPWPKSRHYKRRLTYRDYLNEYSRILKPGGTIEFKTDNRPLFEFSLCELGRTAFCLERVWLDLHEDEPSDNVRTEYERKFSERGMPIYKLEARNAK